MLRLDGKGYRLGISSMPKRIVWIDPDIDVINPVVRPLECAGYKILRLRTVQQAVEAVDQIHAADLILLAMMVPPGSKRALSGRYSGKELLHELRTVYQVTTPALIFTSLTHSPMLEQLRTLGVIGVIQMPVLPSLLKTYVEEAFAAIS
jgi:CheY-like chemotaxis protein